MGLGLDMLDVAIGVVFVFLLISLIASAIAELIEVWLKRRSKDLERGICEMLENRDTLVAALYNHPLVLSLYKGSDFAKAKDKDNLPSYIPARNFALAAMDLLFPTGEAKTTTPVVEKLPMEEYQKQLAAAAALGKTAVGAADDLRAYVKQNPVKAQQLTYDDLGPKLAAAVVSIMDTAKGDAVKTREALEKWFNSGMDRVAGWYKRWSHKVLIVIGLVLAVAFNVDTIAITQALSVDKSLRDATVQTAVDFSKKHPVTAQPSPPAGTASQPTKPAPTTDTDVTAGTTNASGTTGTTGTTSTAKTDTTSTSSGVPTPAQPSNTATAQDLEKQITEYSRIFHSLGLPVGWTDDWNAWETAKKNDANACDFWWKLILGHLLGWLITAFAVSMGAPFWFDTLNKIIVIRSTVKPQEKSQDEPSKG